MWSFEFERRFGLNLHGDLVFNFERLNIFWVIIGYPSQKLWPFEFAKGFHVQFRASWYIMSRYQTSESKVMTIQVKSYGHLNLPRASMFNFERLRILWAAIRHPSQKLWSFEFIQIFRVEFQVSQYIMDLNQTLESKFMAVRICQRIAWSILIVSIYYGPQSDIWVESYAWLNLVGYSWSDFELVDILWVII